MSEQYEGRESSKVDHRGAENIKIRKVHVGKISKERGGENWRTNKKQRLNGDKKNGDFCKPILTPTFKLI